MTWLTDVINVHAMIRIGTTIKSGTMGATKGAVGGSLVPMQ